MEQVKWLRNITRELLMGMQGVRFVPGLKQKADRVGYARRSGDQQRLITHCHITIQERLK